MSKLNYFYICMINFAATVKIVVDVVITDTSSTSCEVISDCHSLRNAIGFFTLLIRLDLSVRNER
jgi:hypothetical protein